MAVPHIKQQINLVIRLAALAMFFLSIMMMAAPVKIKRQGNVVPWRDNTFYRLYCEINVSDSSHQSWAGFMVCINILFLAIRCNNQVYWTYFISLTSTNICEGEQSVRKSTVHLLIRNSLAS